MSAQGLLHNPALFEPLLALNLPPSPIGGPQPDEAAARDAIESSPAYYRHRRTIGPFTGITFAVSFPAGSGSEGAAERRADDDESGQQAAGSKAKPSGGVKSVAGAVPSSFICTTKDVMRQFRLAKEYLEICEKYPPAHPSIVRRHVFFMLFDFFQVRARSAAPLAHGWPSSFIHRCLHMALHSAGLNALGSTPSVFHRTLPHDTERVRTQANVDIYDRLCRSPVDKASLVPILAALLERAKSRKPHVESDEGVKRTRRRDGTIAPPPWPVGGGGMAVSGNPDVIPGVGAVKEGGASHSKKGASGSRTPTADKPIGPGAAPPKTGAPSRPLGPQAKPALQRGAPGNGGGGKGGAHKQHKQQQKRAAMDDDDDDGPAFGPGGAKKRKGKAKSAKLTEEDLSRFD